MVRREEQLDALLCLGESTVRRGEKGDRDAMSDASAGSGASVGCSVFTRMLVIWKRA